MVTDPISDMLIQIKNAVMAKLPMVVIPCSNLKEAVANVLVREGFLKSVTKKGTKIKKLLYCEIAYDAKGQAKFTDVKRVSKLSCRVYKGVDEIRAVKQGKGLAVLTTPKGVLTNKEARQEKVGGELMFEIW